ncbi:MAG: LAGLIDADG family homing endonuclease [Nanoarchaeota archaeon]
MLNKANFSKELLKRLYEDEKLTTFQIAEKLKCCQTTIWKKLKEHNIPSRLSGMKRVTLTKEELKDFYTNKKLSTWQIEEKTKIPRGTIYRKLKEFGISTRDRSDSQVIYPKKDFSGNLLEKAYLIGFRLGDLGVRKQYPHSKIICVASGSTIKEQIDLINGLFEKYGHVWIKKTKDNKINIQTFLNESFDFLLPKEFPLWIQKNEKLFFSFLAGFSDAEGCISKSNKVDYYSLGNYDNKTLFRICKNLNKFGIKCNEPRSDNRKGKFNSEGYSYRSDYWSIRIYNKKNLLKLLLKLKPFIKHENKIKDLNNSVDNIIRRNNEKAKK